MLVNHNREYLSWDRTEAVQVEQATAGGRRRYAVEIAKGREIRSREKSPSGGVYLGAERRWHIPRVLLPEGFAIRPKDVIVDANGARDTVQTASLMNLKSRWECSCLNLILAYDLRETVVIQRATLSFNAAGVAVKTFDQVLYTLLARAQPITADIAEERGIRYSEGQYSVIVSDQVDGIDVSQDRVAWTDLAGTVQYLDIVSLRNPDRIDELPVLECKLKL